MWVFSKKVINVISSPEFIKFFISGVTAFVLDTGILLFCTRVLQFNPQIFGIISGANIISLSLSAIVSFLLQRKWAFKSTEQSVKKQSGKYLIVFAFSYVLNNLIFGFFTFNLGLVDFVAKFVVSGMQMVWNFFLYKFFVFTKN